VDSSARRHDQKRPTTVSKETYYSVKRDLLQCQKRPTEERSVRIARVRERAFYQELSLIECQKRPTTVCQKRPTTVSKEERAFYEELSLNLIRQSERNAAARARDLLLNTPLRPAVGVEGGGGGELAGFTRVRAPSSDRTSNGCVFICMCICIFMLCI